jgi:hypothetical protein
MVKTLNNINGSARRTNVRLTILSTKKDSGKLELRPSWTNEGRTFESSRELGGASLLNQSVLRDGPSTQHAC